MAEFRLFTIRLILMLPFTAVTEQFTELSAEVGGEVTLLCGSGKNYDERCSSTTWLFSSSRNSAAVTLFEHGQIHKDAGSKSARLSVAVNCSLVIKKVTAEDHGRYSCRQFRSGEQVTDSYTDLSVINTAGTSPSSSSITVRVGDTATLPCENGKDFLSRYHNTTWLFGGSGNGAAVPLFEHGQIHKDAGSKSARLSVAVNCSLVIKKVTAEDHGRYTCRQFRSGEQVTDSYTDLSVINSAGTSPSSSSITVRVGDTATLPCENGKDFLSRYHNTTWLFGGSGNGAGVTLFEYGQIHKDAGSKSARLSVAVNCSLVIKKVTAEDHGRYTCRQFRSGQDATDSYTDLSIINNENTATTSTAEMPNSTSPKSTTAATESTTIRRVTSPATTKSSITGETKPTPERANSSNTDLTKTMLIILAVGFTVLFTIMAVIGWRRTKQNKTQRSDEVELNADYCSIPEISQDRANPAGAYSYATIGHTNKTKKKYQANPAAGVSYASIKKANKKTRVHSKYHKDDLWTHMPSTSFSDDNSIYVNMKRI